MRLFCYAEDEDDASTLHLILDALETEPKEKAFPRSLVKPNRTTGIGTLLLDPQPARCSRTKFGDPQDNFLQDIYLFVGVITCGLVR